MKNRCEDEMPILTERGRNARVKSGRCELAVDHEGPHDMTFKVQGGGRRRVRWGVGFRTEVTDAPGRESSR